MASEKINYSSLKKFLLICFGGDKAALPAGTNIGINGNNIQNILQMINHKG